MLSKAVTPPGAEGGRLTSGFLLFAALVPRRSLPSTARRLAVGETVILTAPPVLSLLKRLMKVQGGAIKMTVSPTAAATAAAASSRPESSAAAAIGCCPPRAAASEQLASLSSPCRGDGTPHGTWTILQQNGPNHLGLWCNA